MTAMDRVIFDSDHEIFRDAVQAFLAKEVTPNIERWRDQGCVDREAFRAAGEHGLLLMWADEQYGGQGLTDFRYEQILLEETALRGDPGFAMTLHSRLVGPYLGELGTEEQKGPLSPGLRVGRDYSWYRHDRAGYWQ